MGSLDSALPLKRESLLRSTSIRSEKLLLRPRSRIRRFLMFKKLDYFQWICAVAVLLCFVVIFQLFLPGSVVETPEASVKDKNFVSGDLMILKEIGGFDFGESIRFEPTKLLRKFRAEAKELNFSSSCCRKPRRFGYRKPQLAMVFADMLADPQHILMVTVATALQNMGYAIQVFSLEDGPVHVAWRNMEVTVTIIHGNINNCFVDWLNYDGIIVNSIEARGILSCFLQEPFKSLPVLWTIHERTLAARIQQYNLSGKFDLISDWEKLFSRATLVFPNYILPMVYSAFDTGNFFVIPGSPAEAWKAQNFRVLQKDNLRVKMGYGPNDLIIGIVGSQFLYNGIWLEHSLVLKALLPLLDFNSHLKIIILSGFLSNNYTLAVETISFRLGWPTGIVKHFSVDGEDIDSKLSILDLVIYGSFIEEQCFPEIMLKAMCFSKLIIAPDLWMIRKYVDDKVNGYLFPKDDLSVLTQVLKKVIVKNKLSTEARMIASTGKNTSKNLNAFEAIEGYALLLQNVIMFPSEVATPKPVTEIDLKLREEWQWHHFDEIRVSDLDRAFRSSLFLDMFERQWNETRAGRFRNSTIVDDVFSYSLWEEEKHIIMANERKRRDEEELKSRTDQPHGTWEDVYRNAKKADRLKNVLHERDEKELERTGQSLCIYEPYFGEGTWPFLHNTSLYRGFGLSTKGRRPGTDDVDGPGRLPIMHNPYYRNILGDFGAFFGIASRIDRLHKNAWIGFQSWRLTARKVSLSNIAEKALINTIEARKHGDTLYFWARLDTDPRSSPQQDFWSFCDAINAGNCKLAFSGTLKETYGIKRDWNSLPPMPVDGSSTWSVMNCWVLPTRSFLEFVMFSRMFVDALNEQFYDEHHQSGHCVFSLSKNKHCYSRVLELLVNIWAYHSGRRIIYINPKSGAMQEQHKLSSRRGKMWIKWFSYATLKSMDEDLAEEMDLGRRPKGWLWPLTGEVFWQGTYERERDAKMKEREKRQKDRKEKQKRHGGPPKQRAIGKYVKPPLQEMQNLTTNDV